MNQGGAGQAELRFAEDDARRMAEVLAELGHVPRAQTEVLLAPSKAEVLAALNRVGAALAEHHARGESSRFVFYYSGHARANAIHLGRDELALQELRERVLALPSELTLIVLDACQSGAISNVKGAEPAAAFSYNSVARLSTQGVAVMASSSASELSQESVSLRGSYFTHHLVVALRGAGDDDHDGMVSLSEAYRYAYDRTLSSTMRTAVGRQHVTLETSLTGQGEVPLSYPARAGAQLELPATLAADVLVEQTTAVVAELHKAPGSALRLALPAGAYTAVLREHDQLASCSLALRDGQATPLDRARCVELDDAEARAKGYFGMTRAGAPHEAWGFELGLGGGGLRQSEYTDRLRDFGFDEPIDILGSLQLELAVSRQLMEHLSAVVELRSLDHRRFERDLAPAGSDERAETFEWSSYGLGLHLRGHLDATDWLRTYAQIGGGLGYTHSKLKQRTEHDFGPELAASIGLFVMPFRHFGLGLQGSYSFAPILDNAIGDTHDSGGAYLTLIVRARTWETP